MEAILALRKHGYPAYPTMGMVIDYRLDGKLIRVVPDAFVVLPPRVLVAVEFERSAVTPKALVEKAWNYRRLSQAGHPIPTLFITETVGAAKTLAALGYRYLLATTLDAVRDGPHGSGVIEDREVAKEPGCWWFRSSDVEGPKDDAPIDLWSHFYAQSKEDLVWRIAPRQGLFQVRHQLTMAG